MSVLYVVGTPIGNLNDFSPRAIETLEKVDFIAAEDTRVTLKLLNHFILSSNKINFFKCYPCILSSNKINFFKCRIQG